MTVDTLIPCSSGQSAEGKAQEPSDGARSASPTRGAAQQSSGLTGHKKRLQKPCEDSAAHVHASKRAESSKRSQSHGLAIKAPAEQKYKTGERPAPLGLKRNNASPRARLHDKAETRSRACGWICKYAGTNKVRYRLRGHCIPGSGSGTAQ